MIDLLATVLFTTLQIQPRLRLVIHPSLGPARCLAQPDTRQAAAAGLPVTYAQFAALPPHHAYGTRLTNLNFDRRHRLPSASQQESLYRIAGESRCLSRKLQRPTSTHSSLQKA